MTSLREEVAAAIWDAPDTRSGDPIGVTIYSSDHLFPQGNETEIEAAKGVCLDAADAAIAVVLERAAGAARGRAAYWVDQGAPCAFSLREECQDIETTIRQLT